MQVARPIILHLPELLMVELEKYIQINPPSWKYDLDYFSYLIHYLTIKQIQLKDKEYFAINTPILKSVIVWNIDRYIRYLVNGEFLKRDYFINGKRAYHYKLNPEYLHGHRKVEVRPGRKLHTSMVQAQRLKRSHVNRLPPYLKLMREHFKKVKLDYDKAEKWIESQSDFKKKYVYYTALEMIKDNRFRYFGRNKTNNRLDHNFTNLKSDLRQFIIGDYVSLDQANSQPFLLGQLIFILNHTISHSNTKTIPLCCSLFDLDVIQWFGLQQINDVSKIRQNDVDFENGELLDFNTSAVSGSFYEDFQQKIVGESLTRDKVKKMMFAVLFSQNVIYKNYKKIIPYRKEKSQFANEYPTIYQIVQALKQKDHRRLSIFLQRIEARIFIDTICPILVDLGVIPLTIHDSIIVDAKHAERALEVCKNVFKEVFSVVPTFHVESLKDH